MQESTGDKRSDPIASATYSSQLEGGDIFASLRTTTVDDRIQFSHELCTILEVEPLENILSHIHDIVAALLVVSEDPEPIVRQCFVDRFANIFQLCQKHASPELDHYLNDLLLDIIIKYLYEESKDERGQAFVNLNKIILLLSNNKNKIEEKIFPAILELSKNTDYEENSELNLMAIRLMAASACILGPEKTEKLILNRFLEYCSFRLDPFRRTCAYVFPSICYAMGVEYTEAKLLDHFFKLCKDNFWGVRKACAEAITSLSLLCSLKCRKERLAPIVVNLAKDETKWVVISTLKKLGPFISTFAEPCITGLVFSELGELHIVNPTDEEFQTQASPELLANYQYYLEQFSENGINNMGMQQIQTNNRQRRLSSYQQNIGDTATTTNAATNFLNSEQIAQKIIEIKTKLFKQANYGYLNNSSMFSSCLDIGSSLQLDKSIIDDDDDDDDEYRNLIEKGFDKGFDYRSNIRSSSTSFDSSSSSTSSSAINITPTTDDFCIGGGGAAEDDKHDMIYSFTIDNSANNRNNPLDEGFIINTTTITNSSIITPSSTLKEKSNTSEDVDLTLNKNKLNDNSTIIRQEHENNNNNDNNNISNLLINNDDNRDISGTGTATGGTGGGCSINAGSLHTKNRRITGPSDLSGIIKKVIGEVEAAKNKDKLNILERKPKERDFSKREKREQQLIEEDLWSSSTTNNSKCLVRKLHKFYDKMEIVKRDEDEALIRKFQEWQKKNQDEDIKTFMEYNSHKYWHINPELPLDPDLVNDNNKLPKNFQQGIVPPAVLKVYVNMIFHPEDEGIKLNCAQNFPAVALTLGKANWHLLKDLLEYLCDDLDWKVRKTIASSIDVLAMILGKEIASSDLLKIYIDFFKDLDEVKIVAIKNAANFLKVIDHQKHEDILSRIGDCLKVDSKTNWRIKEDLAKQVLLLIRMYNFVDKQDSFLYVTSLTALFLEDKISCVRELAADAMVEIIQIANPNELEGIIKLFLVKEFGFSDSWRKRQTFLNTLLKLLKCDQPPEDLLYWVFECVEKLSKDAVPNVRLLVAKCINQLLKVDENIYKIKQSEFYAKHIAQMIRQLQTDKDRDVRDIINGIDKTLIVEYFEIVENFVNMYLSNTTITTTGTTTENVISIAAKEEEKKEEQHGGEQQREQKDHSRQQEETAVEMKELNEEEIHKESAQTSLSLAVSSSMVTSSSTSQSSSPPPLSSSSSSSSSNEIEIKFRDAVTTESQT